MTHPKDRDSNSSRQGSGAEDFHTLELRGTGNRVLLPREASKSLPQGNCRIGILQNGLVDRGASAVSCTMDTDLGHGELDRVVDARQDVAHPTTDLVRVAANPPDLLQDD